MVAVVSISNNDSIDHEIVYDWLISKISSDYDLDPIHKYCNVIEVMSDNYGENKDNEDEETKCKVSYQFVFPFVEELGEMTWAELRKSSKTITGLEVFKDDIMESTQPIKHFDSYEGKYTKLAKRMENKTIRELKSKIESYTEKYDFEIARSNFDVNVIETNDTNKTNSSMDNEVQQYFADILKHVNIKRFDKTFCGMMKHLMIEAECDFRCLRIVNANKCDLITKSKLVACSMMQFDCLAWDKIAEDVDNKDNVEDYINLIKMKIVEDQINDASDDYNPNSIAIIFSVFYRSKVLYCGKTSSMYCYKQHLNGWETMDENSMFNFIDNNFRNMMSKVANIKNTPTAILLKNVSKNMMKKPLFAKKLATLIKFKLMDNTFYELADSKPVLRLMDCVVDINVGNIEVRPGRPDDYCTKSGKACFEYDQDMTKDDIESVENELQDILSKIFPSVEILIYAMLYFASALTYGNTDKLVMIFLGSGNNGKSDRKSVV